MLAIGGGANNRPFSAVVKSTFEQKLPDGNAIHTVTRSHVARNSAGKTMTEMPQGCVRGLDGQMHERLNVNVNDPVARTGMNWRVGDDTQPKVVYISHQPEMPPRPATQPTPEELAQRQKIIQAARAQQALRQKEDHTEDLGTRDFNGVLAHGTTSLWWWSMKTGVPRKWD
jgi:hypothetical protein